MRFLILIVLAVSTLNAVSQTQCVSYDDPKRVEPEGRYFFKYAQLKEFLKPGSVVSQFLQ
jgi:hypothetical protein